MKKIHLTFLLLSFMILSCTTTTNYVYLQKNLVNELNYAKIDYKNLDIYLSRTIQLANGIQENTLSIKNGELVRNTNNTGKKVIIRSLTPGKIVFQPSENEIGVSFDKKDPTKFLMFGLDKSTGAYTLLAKKWGAKEGDITYGDMVYKTSAQNNVVKLLVIERKTSNINYEREIASGRR
jgi:hypothetical protein